MIEFFGPLTANLLLQVFPKAVVPSDDDGVVKKIKSFGVLPDGWDFGQGRPSPANVVTEAIKFYQLGKNLGLITEAFPGVDGGITLMFGKGVDALEMQIESSLAITITHERGLGYEYEIISKIDTVDLNRARRAVLEFSGVELVIYEQGAAWKQLGSSTLIDILSTTRDSQVLPLRTIRAASPYSIVSAPQPQRQRVTAGT